jgi:hypothetical protein
MGIDEIIERVDAILRRASIGRRASQGFRAAPFASADAPLQYTTKAANGGDAVRNSCPVCGSLVFGGEVGKDSSFTIYAGTLDDPSSFRPTAAIFARSRPAWAVIPPGLTIYDAMPPE